MEQPEEQRGQQPQQPPHATQRRLSGRPCCFEDGCCGGRGSLPRGCGSGTSVPGAAVGGVEQLRKQELGALLGLEQLGRRLVRNLRRRVRPRSGCCGPAAVVPVHVHADHDHVEQDREDHRDHQHDAFCAHALEAGQQARHRAAGSRSSGGLAREQGSGSLLEGREKLPRKFQTKRRTRGGRRARHPRTTLHVPQRPPGALAAVGWLGTSAASARLLSLFRDLFVRVRQFCACGFS